MAKTKVRFRRLSPDEQAVLNGMTLRLLESPADRQRCDQLLTDHHYLHNAQLVGEHLRYAVTWRGQWLALATWSAAALHLKPRDRFIGWTPEQRRQRLPLVVNNSRLFVLEDCHYPNLVSRFMKLMLARLSNDWTAAWGHPVVLAETFVDPQQYRGTAYQVSGWSQLGHTCGWRRSAVDFYEKHDQPKQVWVRALVKNACAKLRAPQLPPAWAAGLRAVAPRCTAKARQITSLRERLERDVPEFRRPQALAYPIAGMLALIAMAMFSGVAKGYDDLAQYAATLSPAQLRALHFRRAPRTRRVRCPKASAFAYVLARVDATHVEQALLAWQEQVLGPTQDRLLILDGKCLRHAGVETVNAVNGAGRWLGSTLVPAGSNEIPAARKQLAKLDAVEKLVIADAAHTQVETARQILYEQGGEYVLTAKANQKELVRTLETLFTQRPFSPSAHGAHPRGEAGTQSRAGGNSGARRAGGDARDGGFSGRAERGAPAAAGAPAGQEDDGDRVSDQQPHAGRTGRGGVIAAQARLLGD